MEHALVEDYIKQKSANVPHIMYFKPSIKLDLLIENKGYKPIGNKAYFNEQFENKLLSHELISRHLPQFTVQTVIGVLGNLNFKKITKELGLPFVIQFGHGWAGKTTFFIKGDEEFCDLAQKYAATQVKVSRKIEGFTVLNNCCLFKNTALISPPAIQVSDIPILFPKEAVTCGRQWPVRFLTNRQRNEINYISKVTGRLMSKMGFRGFFGLDFLIEESTGRVYASEINARLTASTSFYTYLEVGLGNIPLLVYHLAAFLGRDLVLGDSSTAKITGSQIILRKTTEKKIDNKLDDFGVYKLKNKQPILVSKDYSLEKLSLSEFIYIKRVSDKLLHEGDELARIETKQEVLTAPKQLQSWFIDFLTRLKQLQTETNQVDNHQ